MANSVNFRLKLLIDVRRNKVVLAETEQDFVDVLISLLTIPMGNIARLLKSHTTVLGCYKNLNKSVEDMDIGHFETEACKTMLTDLRSTKDIHRKRLKMNMSSTNPSKFFVCPSFFKSDSYGHSAYSNFKNTRCSCGALMTYQIQVPEEEQVEKLIGNKEDGVFVNCRSSFIVTDDLKVTSNSIGVLMKVLNDRGYAGFSDLQETLIDVGFEEVRSLLGCLLSSEAALTCTFLKKTRMMRNLRMLSPPAPKNVKVCSVEVYVRKLDMEILYAECNGDFVDSLLSFLVHPLELACSLSNDNTILGCVGNLCKSQCRGEASKSLLLPSTYSCSNNNLLDYGYQSTTYECLIRNSYSSCEVARSISRLPIAGEKAASLYPSNPKIKSGTSSGYGTGFMKKNTKFIVSNDLTITPMNTSSTIGLLKKLQVDISDLEKYQINISKVELISILRASLISSSALTKGLSNLLVKKPKEEA
ncbi:unnamed protein product [Brassica rapa]|uniref:DUF674 family protein n=1 Tax=Brassica campestris TaxID=3711 RepID=A0A8D9HRE0_BRACM|nr:unnamed protein product [Brassica rapa]